jgi:carboxyl-terminal processing protease
MAGLFVLAALGSLPLACATGAAGPASAVGAQLPSTGSGGAPPEDPRLRPPPFASTTPAPPPLTTPEAREDSRTVARRRILDAAWRAVRDRHYDPTLGGVDWAAIRTRYEPLALGAPDEAAFYRTLNQMLGELGQSHMQISGPGAADDEADGDRPPPSEVAGAPPTATSAAPAMIEGLGDPGVTVRSIEGRAVVTAVRAGSSAARQGIRPGFVVLEIGGRKLAGPGASSPRPLRPVEERFRLRRTATSWLQGPVGTRVTVKVLDDGDRPLERVLERDRLDGPVRQIGHLPPLHPETRVSVIDGVGVLAFNLFLIDPTLGDVKRAIDRFRALRVKGVILDLRGNPGGIGAMAIPVAAELVRGPTTLGTVHFRTFKQTFTAQPSLGRTPFTGPLVILTDEGTASTSEILTGGLQEAGRARVVGDTTLGAVLPSVVEALPGGAVIQVVVADFQTPKGILLEGRGVQPDTRVVETRAAFASGHDPVLEAALDTLRGRTTRAPRRVKPPTR